MAICQEYIPTEWFDNTAPAINAANLNHLEIGIKQATDCSIENSDAIDNLEQIVGTLLPSGIITAFAPNLPIPSGWAICDGNNGTPDLRDKFIYGGDGSNSGLTGGYRDGSVIDHTHIATFYGDNVPPHGHYFNPDYDVNAHVGSGQGQSQILDAGNRELISMSMEAGIVKDATPVTGTVAIHNTGDIPDDRNLPPYIVLMYIMKL